MNKNQAIIHILTLCEGYKSYIHWQMTARIVLGSLFLDDRITAEIRADISQEIANYTLPNYDYLIKPKPVVVQNIPREVTEARTRPFIKKVLRKFGE